MNTTRTEFLLLFPLFGLLASCSSIPNANTTELMVNGNCDMCVESIEAAVEQPGLSKGSWDPDTRVAILTFDSTRTSKEAVLRRIANSGYDNEMYLAPDAAYANLPLCCQYERTGTTITPPAKGTSGHGH